MLSRAYIQQAGMSRIKGQEFTDSLWATEELGVQVEPYSAQPAGSKG